MLDNVLLITLFGGCVRTFNGFSVLAVFVQSMKVKSECSAARKETADARRSGWNACMAYGFRSKMAAGQLWSPANVAQQSNVTIKLPDHGILLMFRSF
jgi:chloramphenicol 3-O-phosphotransferase